MNTFSQSAIRPVSFRLKITVWMVFLSGIVLAAFTSVFLVVTWRLGVDRLDREIVAVGNNSLRSNHPAGYWTQLGTSLNTIMGEERADQWFVHATRLPGKRLFETPELPVALGDHATAWLKARRVEIAAKPSSEPDPADVHLEAIEMKGRDLPERERERLKGNVLLMVDAGMSDAEIQQFVDRSLEEAGFRGGAGRPPRNGRPGGPEGGRERNSRRLHPIPAQFETLNADGIAYRVALMANEEISMLVAAPLVELHAEHRRLVVSSVIGFGFALGLLAVGGRILAGRALRPVRVIAKTVAQVSARDLDQRVPHTEADQEFAHLVDGVNGMLERLERGFHQATRFSADAAHELNTPLTVLQGEVEALFQAEAEGSAQQLTYATLLEEIQCLKAITHKLLLLSKADAGKLPLDVQPVNLSELIAAAVEDTEVLAEGLEVESEIPPNIMVPADAVLLRQIITNLTTNAIKYNRPGGFIRVQLERNGEGSKVSVTNSAEDLKGLDPEKIFERFYRADNSRTREGFGAGLGLSLSREIAQAHGGTLTVDAMDGHEVRFALVLPDK